MDRGQHSDLLKEIIKNLELFGSELVKRAQQARISSESPGKSPYDNKCTFHDGSYIAVLQTKGPKNQGIQLVWGYGSQDPADDDRAGDTLPWKPDDIDVKNYARRNLVWLVNKIRKATWPT